jgi:glycosyltransferase involved in cell wall biosynthesis
VSTRKGLTTLIAAFAQTKLEEDVRLVLAGPDGWGADEVTTAIRDRGVGDRVHRLGRVGDAQLAALYTGCLAVCVPSLAEGFGLTVLEGLAAGAPVVASDLPVLREVAGDAAVYATPGEPEAWTAALERLVGDGGLRRDLAARGAAAAAPFTWQRTAASTRGAYERARNAE